MKHLSKLIAIILFFGVVQVQSQEKTEDKELTFEDAIYFNREILPERLSNLKWQENSKYYTRSN